MIIPDPAPQCPNKRRTNMGTSKLRWTFSCGPVKIYGGIVLEESDLEPAIFQTKSPTLDYGDSPESILVFRLDNRNFLKCVTEREDCESEKYCDGNQRMRKPTSSSRCNCLRFRVGQECNREKDVVEGS
ncbi:hypothetical protein AVEN_57847-1 [Araneus ventricosus]|uniref:Uncharacterized protein n=1 Tax=Araneus ventricosus TaxID=182803 RepID=A0A4Y2WR53_ARAVE|nr:hypothetical protein AVEN_57847-1 [Araneus ventricosus]